MRTTCDTCCDQLLEYPSLATELRQQVDEHLRHCAECRLLHEEMQTMESVFQHAMPADELPADFADGVLSAVTSEPLAPPARRVVPWLTAALLAELALVMVLRLGVEAPLQTLLQGWRALATWSASLLPQLTLSTSEWTHSIGGSTSWLVAGAALLALLIQLTILYLQQKDLPHV